MEGSSLLNVFIRSQVQSAVQVRCRLPYLFAGNDRLSRRRLRNRTPESCRCENTSREETAIEGRLREKPCLRRPCVASIVGNHAGAVRRLCRRRRVHKSIYLRSQVRDYRPKFCNERGFTRQFTVPRSRRGRRNDTNDTREGGRWMNCGGILTVNCGNSTGDKENNKNEGKSSLKKKKNLIYN